MSELENKAIEALILEACSLELQKAELSPEDVEEAQLPPLTEEARYACQSMSDDVLELLAAREEALEQSVDAASEDAAVLFSGAATMFRGSAALSAELEAEMERREREALEKLEEDEDEQS